MNRLLSPLALGLFLGSFGAPLAGTAMATPAHVDGKAVFDRNCSVCHSIQPPPKSAPPVVPLSSRYHLMFQSKEQGVSRMVSFLKAPSREKAVADAQAITRFGLMPAISLSDEKLNAVAGWVWDQYSDGSTGPGSGAGRGRGNCRQQ
jgi:mono/diheme cytochrome c family protein